MGGADSRRRPVLQEEGLDQYGEAPPPYKPSTTSENDHQAGENHQSRQDESHSMNGIESASRDNVLSIPLRTWSGRDSGKDESEAQRPGPPDYHSDRGR